MTRRWGKLDVKLHENDKFRNLPATAAGIWLVTLTWAADNETDGFVPHDVLVNFIFNHLRGTPSKRIAGYLIKAGLWHEVDGGYMIHDFADYQLTKEKKTKVRADDRRRQTAHRQHSDSTPTALRQHSDSSEGLFPGESVASRRDPAPKSKSKSERRETSSLVPVPQGSAAILDNWWRVCNPKPTQGIYGHARKVVDALLTQTDDWHGVNAAVAEWHKIGKGTPGYIETVYFQMKNVQNRPQLSTTDIRVGNTWQMAETTLRALDEADPELQSHERGITS